MIQNQSKFVHCLIFTSSLIAISILSKANLQAEEHHFTLQIVGDIKMNTQGNQQAMKTDTHLAYSWEVENLKRQLRYQSLAVKVVSDGNLVMDVYKDHSKVSIKSANGNQEVAVEDAAQSLKTELQDSYLSPLAVLEVDDFGKVNKMTNVAKPGANALVETGAIVNALLFHPPFYPDKKSWEAEVQFSAGPGIRVKGDLTYQKSDQSGDEQKVKITGTISNENIMNPASPVTMKKIVYKVSGDQTYNLKLKEWKSGKMNIDLTMEMEVNQQPLGKGTGTMEIQFKFDETP